MIKSFPITFDNNWKFPRKKMIKPFYPIYLAVLQVSILQLSISHILQKPDGEHAEFLHRFRRRINKYEGVGPIEYMKELRDGMADEIGSPIDPANDPTSVWCLMDKDIIEDHYHPKPLNRKCMMEQKFNFSLESLSTEFNSNMKLSKSLLRVYLQPISRLQPVGDEVVDLQVNITARAFSNNSICGGSTFISSNIMTVTKDTEDHWDELNITSGFKNCWDSIDNISYIEITIHFERLHCVPGKKKIPIEIADPAIVPATEVERRERHWPLQPFVLIFVDDEEEKKKMMLSQQPAIKPDELVINEYEGGSNSTLDSREKREIADPCKLSPLEINFADLGLHYILSPYSYNAFQCLGDCSKRSIGNNEVNNHAILVASAKQYYDDNPDIPNTAGYYPNTPRCVSLNYSYLKVVVFARDKQVVVTSYPSMLGTLCGCRA